MNYYDFCIHQFQQNVFSHRLMKRDRRCIKISSAISNDKETSEDCWTFTTPLSVVRQNVSQNTLARGPAGN
jgi:hypothetical protein